MPTTFTGIQNENEFYSHHYLLYVSATRARKELTVLSFGKPSPFLS